MPDGAITASLASSFDEDGRTFTSNIGRQMTLKAGELSYSFGLSGSDNGDLNPLYAVSYSQELPRDAAANVRLSQSFATNGTGREAVNEDVSVMNFGVNYSHALAQDWGIVTGYTHSMSSSDQDGDDSTNTVFVGLQKDFSWRP